MVLLIDLGLSWAELMFLSLGCLVQNQPPGKCVDFCLSWWSKENGLSKKIGRLESGLALRTSSVLGIWQET